VPESVFDQVATLVAAFGVVAAFAALLAGAARVLARGEQILPPWRRWPSSLTGVDVFVLFLASQLVMFGWVAVFDRLAVADVVATVPAVVPDGVGGAVGGPGYVGAAGMAGERRFWTGAFAQAAALPTFLLAWWALHRATGGRRTTPAPRPGRFAADVVAGVLAWAVVTPATFAVFIASLWVQQRFGGTADEHPLKLAGAGESVGRIAVFFASACVFPAVYEELVFRRILLPWAVGRTDRPWFVMVLAAGLTVLLSVGRDGSKAGPIGFAALLIVGLYVLQRAYSGSGRFATRTAGGIYASAALFGLLHSHVWPTPIPLFVFGLGVGYVAARTRSVWPAVVTHGLFNAVSAVVVLRGP
jgi:membrane protease YdiL (CAAX protease family)